MRRRSITVRKSGGAVAAVAGAGYNSALFPSKGTLEGLQQVVVKKSAKKSAKPAKAAKPAAKKMAKPVKAAKKAPAKKAAAKPAAAKKAPARKAPVKAVKKAPAKKAPAKTVAKAAPAKKPVAKAAAPARKAKPVAKKAAAPAVKTAPVKTAPAPKKKPAVAAAPAPQAAPAKAAKPAPAPRPQPVPAPRPVALPKGKVAKAVVTSRPATPAPKAKVKVVPYETDPESGRPVVPAGYKPGADEEYMGPLQLEYFRQRLLQWRADLVEESKQTIENLKDEVRDVGDEAERATRETENSLELRTRDRYRKLIGKIDSTLKRVDSGEYGYSVDSGEEIGLDRLEARLTAERTIDEQERWEHLQKQIGD
ncbi:RNA polymerase-binding protein DksA [Luteimonas marina]|uniref:RNA polymerase-binding transcription factor DksA n=2 Tax=Luteimonas marina TaxID=488485 RepID=A0A5C5UCH4_9GAMM|nr:RNA polymerase-binding protein DksA [Luteimonas marina]